MEIFVGSGVEGGRNVVVDKTDPIFSLYSPIIGFFTPESPS